MSQIWQKFIILIFRDENWSQKFTDLLQVIYQKMKKSYLNSDFVTSENIL